MKTSKFIQFDSIADLAAKLEKLIAHREKTLLESRNWLIKHNMQYQVLPNGDLGVNTDTLYAPENQALLEDFNKIGAKTREVYRSLGVVFMETYENCNELVLNVNEHGN